MRLVTSIIILLLNWTTLVTAYLASFYGNSFLFQQASGSLPSDITSVSLRFQTSSADGILFLGLGYRHFLLIELSRGKLEVKVNLGNGEEIFSTPEDKSLNNLIWHEFKVIRSRSNIKLVLNGKDVLSDHIVTKDVRKPVLDLNFGVFVGGIGGNVTLPHGIRPSKFYRGCLLSVEINGKDILAPLTNIPNSRILYNVVSGCPKIFRASRSESLTFDQPSSYIAMRRWTTQDEGKFECTVKTLEKTGIILYNAGRGRGEFIGLEMVDGVIGASVNKGGGVVALHTTRRINDGSWHTVRFSFSPSYLEIIVNGNQTKVFFEQTNPRLEGGLAGVRHYNLDLAGHLYIGGIPRNELKMTQVPHSLISLSGSKDTRSGGAFPGCMKNIRIDGRRKGFSDFLISNKISAGCPKNKNEDKKDYFQQEDYESANIAVSDLFTIFNLKQLEAQTSTTTRATTTTSTTTTSTTTTTRTTTINPRLLLPNVIVTIQPLAVLEGGSKNLSQQELSVSILGQNTHVDLLFIVSSKPSHGHFAQSRNCESGDEVTEFTMGDIGTKSVTYCHDGSETETDKVEFQIVWDLHEMDTSERNQITSQLVGVAQLIGSRVALNGGTSYRLPVLITPVNDPPELHIPVEYLFRPVRRTKTHLPADILNATDPDSPPSHIMYVLLGSFGTLRYRIENEQNPGRALTSFTQEDVNLNKMVFVHQGDIDNTRLVLRLANIEPNSEGVPATLSSSATAVLRIAAVPINMTVLAKQVAVLERSSIVLSEQYLLTTSNAEAGSVDFQYRIKETLSLGIVQVTGSVTDTDGDGEWVNASGFTQSQLLKGLVRYKNLRISEATDDVEIDRLVFTVTGAGIETSPHTLQLQVQKVNMKLMVSPIHLVNGTRELPLANAILRVDITHLNTSSDQIKIKLAKAIEHVHMYYNDNDSLIQEEDFFTLEEAESGRVSIKVQQEFATQTFEESGEFVAVVSDIYTSDPATLEVVYEPDLEKIQLVNKGLLVTEGKEKVIDDTVLKASFLTSPDATNVEKFLFTVVHGPLHGNLILTNGGEASKQIVDDGAEGINQFTSIDLEMGKVVYRHDDSESTSDSFSFRVIPKLDGLPMSTVTKFSNSYLESNLSIGIEMVNDEKPTRLVHSTFEIARHSERLLTKDDIWYHDPDVDFDDLDLVYRRRGIINGEILNATDGISKIYEFTQRDIVDRKVLFRHKKKDFGRFVIWVNDGKYEKAGVFVVYASDPFVKIKRTSRLVVLRGQVAAIAPSNLWSSTNVKSNREDIIYRVTKPPSHGILVSNTTRNAVKTFTQQDIYNKTVVYKHDGSSVLKDSFEFKVSAGEASFNGSMEIVAFLESYEEPPEVEANATIIVGEGMRVQIQKKDLRIVHSDTDPEDMVMTVTENPEMGHLEYTGDETDQASVANFTQADINDGVLWYVHRASSSSEQFQDGRLSDYFVFELTNGFYKVRDLRLNFEIVPNVVPLRLSNFSILEGGRIAITGKYLHIAGPHFGGDDVRLNVTVPPSHGTFESNREHGSVKNNFLLQEVYDGNVYYAHDGSDTLEDSFSVQASTTDGKKQSKVVTSYITIAPDNDQLPILVNNTGMNVWINSTTEFSSAVLGSVDNDTDPHDLNYKISAPSNGWVAVKGNLTRPILNFTQWDVDNGLVVFVHRGPSTGGFTFQVHDGVNVTPKRICVITAKLLILTLRKNTGIEVFPGAAIPITSDVLLSDTNDDGMDGRLITYAVTVSPRLGKIMMKSSNKSCESGSNPSEAQTFTEVNTFTQADIDNGIIVFMQGEELSSWSEMDFCVFNISSPPATSITDVRLLINVTYDAYEVVRKSGPVSVNEGFTVIEGGKVVIRNDVLDASNVLKKLPSHRDKTLYELRYSITRLPLHGNLSLSGINVTILNTTFTQKDLIGGRVAYRHDHSDTMNDSFGFDVYLIDKKFSSTTGRLWVVPRTLLSDCLNITISPLNDNPPKLMTKGKYLTVIDGFTTPILPSVLYTTDPDNTPEEIMYIMIRQPSKGRVVLSHDMGNDVTKFTQADVDDGKISFVPHDVTGLSTTDALYFSVTDGTQRPLYNLFQIKIVPVYMNFQPMPLEVTQGLFSLSLTPRSFNISTNGDHSLVSFRIVEAPKSGVVLVNEQETSTFSYDDIRENKVTFAMVDSKFPSDKIGVIADYNRTRGNNISVFATIDIKVTPLSVIGWLPVSSNGLTRLELSVLNATALFQRTNSMPVYDIIKPLRYAVVMKVFPPTNESEHTVDSALEQPGMDEENTDAIKRVNRRDTSEYSDVLREVDAFSHDDVAMGYVFMFVPLMNLSDASSATDGMTLRLTVEDDSVQPAEFDFNFTIDSSKAEDYSSFLDQFMAKETETASDPEGASKMVDEMVANVTTMHEEDGDVEIPTEMYVPPAIEQTEASLIGAVPRNDLSKHPEDAMSESAEPTEASTNLPWLIPVAIAVACLIMLLICMSVVCYYRCVLTKEKDIGKTPSEGGSSYQPQDRNSRIDEGIVPGLTDDESRSHRHSSGQNSSDITGELLMSPACPEVTVRLLNKRTYPHAAAEAYPLMHGGDLPSLGMLSGSVPHTRVLDLASYRDDPSLRYMPPGMYEYEDAGSVLPPNGPDYDFYAVNGGSYDRRRLYHTQSDKLLDPTLLSRFSSEESLPSVANDQYASPGRVILPTTTSVPSGLNRSLNRPSPPKDPFTASRSTASLMVMSPELTLLPNTGLEQDQYWI